MNNTTILEIVRKGFEEQKDIKILENTINKAVDTIRSTGIDAVKGRTETEDFIEYTVRIPKGRNNSETPSFKTA